MKTLAPVAEVHSQVSAVDFDLGESQERKATERDWTEIRIPRGLDDVDSQTTGSSVDHCWFSSSLRRSNTTPPHPGVIRRGGVRASGEV